MTDQQTLAAPPDSAAAEAATEVAETAPPAPPSAADPPPLDASAPRGRRSVQVPMWLLVVVIGLVAVAGAFLVGRETAPDSAAADGPDTLAEAVEATASGQMDVGEFDARTLIQALSQNEDLDLGILEDLLLGGSGRG